ncbi:MAG: isoprenylcysteine carboxylmethyltransferase family protein [Candidatus Acidiferrum sp.]
MLMAVIYDYLFPAMWFVYTAYWWAMSKDVKESKRHEPGASRFARMVLILGALALLWLPRVPVAVLNNRFLPPGTWSFWAGAAVTAGGMLFSVWARRHLGKNWSQAVTLKEDHELITSGPYALVRHPIYTGLLFAIVGCALGRGEWRGVLAVALVFGALWQKLKLEEKWMRAQFGESYEAYSRRVAALVPHIL